jgi:hypothetical protein
MNRVSVAAAVIAAGVTGAAAASVAPAMAASPAAAPARHGAAPKTITKAVTAVQRAGLAAGQASVPGLSAASIAASSDSGKYVTVVHCAGVDAPAPIRVGAPGTPLTVTGVAPSAEQRKLLAQAHAYKPVYACTVVVEMKAAAPAKKKASCEIAGAAATAGASGRRGAAGCTKKVTLNTGFGGLATPVSHHRPAS